eukprot:364398-Chlamydomonas_euryale.AAC.25
MAMKGICKGACCRNSVQGVRERSVPTGRRCRAGAAHLLTQPSSTALRRIGRVRGHRPVADLAVVSVGVDRRRCVEPVQHCHRHLLCVGGRALRGWRQADGASTRLAGVGERFERQGRPPEPVGARVRDGGEHGEVCRRRHGWPTGVEGAWRGVLAGISCR